ncbi:MAG: amidohydrolase family protein, partial [Halioglobus sp.]
MVNVFRGSIGKCVSALALVTSLGAFSGVTAAQESAPAQILFKNVKVFDGKTNKLSAGQNVLVEGELIKAIGSGASAGPNAHVIDGGGRTLMPGLIDGHAHVMINRNFGVIETNMDLTDMSYNATVVMKRFLMDGFTTVRDMGGPTFGLARAIDQGTVVGSRMYPSGSFIS